MPKPDIEKPKVNMFDNIQQQQPELQPNINMPKPEIEKPKVNMLNI